MVGNELNYYIASCAAFAKLMAKAQCIPSERFLKIGMPRNDIFFIKSKRAINNKKVREKYCLKENWKVILYAPTWRDDGRASEIKDICEVVADLNKVKQEKHILLCRAHHAGNLINNFNVEEFINVTDYPDMQELLCAADILITDYSSCMWDFSLMYKPCFIYAMDIDQYKQERDFYTPMSEWPFTIAANTDELINNILVKLHLRKAPVPETEETACENEMEVSDKCVPSSQSLIQNVLQENKEKVRNLFVSNERIAKIYAVLWYARPANRLPLLILTSFRLVLVAFFIVTAVHQLLTENVKVTFVLLVGSVFLIMQSKWLLNQYLKMESQFLDNLNGEISEKTETEEIKH